MVGEGTVREVDEKWIVEVVDGIVKVLVDARACVKCDCVPR